MILLSLLLLTIIFGAGFTICGALLSVFVWMFIKLPLGVLFAALGLGLCCTILLIPIGVEVMKFGGRLMIPGGVI